MTKSSAACVRPTAASIGSSTLRTLAAVRIRTLTPLLVQGDDTRKYLQAQLTQDVRRLAPNRALLSAITTAQGRVQTLLTLVERPEGVFMLVPPHAVTALLERMRRMTLRAKVSFHEPGSWAVATVTARDSRELLSTVPDQPGASVHDAATSLLRWWSPDERCLALVNREQIGLREPDTDAVDRQWQAADLAAGLANIYPQTRESFIPQDLNLDLLDALSYEKGCYIGQEVVARARRAATRRRMFRFSAACPPPSAGTRVTGEASEIGEVVEAVPTDTGCELLAVIEVEHHPGTLTLETGVSLQALGLACSSTPCDGLIRA